MTLLAFLFHTQRNRGLSAFLSPWQRAKEHAMAYAMALFIDLFLAYIFLA